MPDYTLILFKLSTAISPSVLLKLKTPEADLSKGVVLSGRGPIWLYCYLVHHYRPAKFVAVHDPRLGGAVLVESHTSTRKVGELMKLEPKF